MHVFPRRHWAVELKDGEPSYLPIPEGHEFSITGARAVNTESNKIVLEAIVQTIRLDRLGEEDDVAQSDIIDTTLAVIFPKFQPNMELDLNFSKFNIVSLRATGGNIVVTGIYNADDGLNTLENFAE